MPHKTLKPYRMIVLSPEPDTGQRRGMIFSRLHDGTVIAIVGDLDRWSLVQPQRTQTRRAWGNRSLKRPETCAKVD